MAASKKQDESIRAMLHALDQIKIESKVDEWVRRANATLRVDGESEIGTRRPAARSGKS